MPLMKFLKGKPLLRTGHRGSSCYFLEQNVTEFCQCPGNLSEAELKNNRLCQLVEKISRQHSIQTVGYLLISVLIQIQSELEYLIEQKDMKRAFWQGKECEKVYKVVDNVRGQQKRYLGSMAEQGKGSTL